MQRAGLLLFLLALPATAQAQPTLQIVSPGAGTCVNNGGELFTGGIAGGEAQPAPRDVPVVLALSEPTGQPVDLVFRFGQEVVLQTTFVPAQQATIESPTFYVPSYLVADGVAKVLTVEASVAGGNSITQNVTFDLDRRIPRVLFDVDDLAQLSGCVAQLPAIPFTVEADALDPNPTLVGTREESEGCLLTRAIHVRDRCGNAQEVRLSGRRPPSANNIRAQIIGYRCGLNECVTSGPDAQTFNHNDRIGRGTVAFDIQSDPYCVDTVQATYVHDNETSILVPGQPFDDEGLYQMSLQVSACGAQPVSASLSFTVVEAPTANAGGPYSVGQGQIITLDASQSSAAPERGGIAKYSWDLDNDGFFDIEGADAVRVPFDASAVTDGEFQIWLMITTGDGATEFDTTTITVIDADPRCEAGGPYHGVEGQAVIFDATGTQPGGAFDPLVAFDWDFGDQRFPQRAAELYQPSHTYAEAGEYTVRLRVEDVDSFCEDTAQVIIDEVGPVVRGAGALNAGALVEGVPVTFSAGETAPGSPFDPLTNFVWSFGLPGASQEGAALRSPSFTYADQGAYTVCLEVFDEDSQTEACFSINVGDLSPEAVVDGPMTAVEGREVIFDASLTTAGGDADRLRALVWNFGDGSPPVRVVDLSQRIQPHVFADQGEYTVTLTAEDEDSTDVDQLVVRVSDVAPTARAQAIYPEGQDNALEGVALRLDASASTPGTPTDPISEYIWNLGDGTEPISTAVPVLDYAWADDGTYIVNVTVVDEDDSSVSTSFLVTVENVEPRLSLFTEEPNLVEVGHPTEFRATIIDAPGDTHSVFWDMGDGQTYEGTTVVEHTYTNLGPVVITVTVDDGDGGTAQAELPIVVTPAAPIVPAVPSQTVAEGEAFHLVIDVQAALRGEDGEFDGPVNVTVPTAPVGMIWNATPDGAHPDQVTHVELSWIPTFYDAGNHVVRITAQGLYSGLVRAREFTIQVTEGGTPMLVAAGGTPSRGTVTFFRYAKRGSQVTFTPQAELTVGLGSGGLVVGDDGRQVFVSVPGSGVVAVVNTIGTPSVVRRIPAGAGTAGLARSAQYLFAVNTADSTLTVIDIETLKPISTVSLAPLVRPVDVAYLPAGFGGILANRLVVTSAGSGELALLDVSAAIRGEPPILQTWRLGGTLSRVVLDEAEGQVLVADGKTRSVYALSAAALDDGVDVAIDGVFVGFSPVDLLVRDGVVYAATGVNLVRLEAGEEPVFEDGITARAITDLPVEVLTGGGLVIADGDEVGNYSADDLQRLISAPAGRIRRLAAFVAIE